MSSATPSKIVRSRSSGRSPAGVFHQSNSTALSRFPLPWTIAYPHAAVPGSIPRTFTSRSYEGGRTFPAPRYLAAVGRRTTALAFLCLLLAGCGSGSDGHALLNRTLGSLGRIGSGNLRASLLLTPRGIPGKTEGVELSGPFALPQSGSLPVARLGYTRVDGARRTSLTLLSTGDRAFVERDGKAYE